MQDTLFKIKKKKEKKVKNNIYVDSSYDWNKTINGKGVGKICILVNNEKPIIEEIELCFPGLKQLNNRFELKAIREAQKIIKERKIKSAAVFSDSRVAVSWARSKSVSWVPRENNLAGLVLDEMKL